MMSTTQQTKPLPPEACVDILVLAARHYGVSPELVIGSERGVAAVSWARQVGMWLCRELTAAPLKLVAVHCGRKCHGSVLHGQTRVDEIRSVSPPDKARTDFLRAMVVQKLRTSGNRRTQT